LRCRETHPAHHKERQMFTHGREKKTENRETESSSEIEKTKTPGGERKGHSTPPEGGERQRRQVRPLEKKRQKRGNWVADQLSNQKSTREKSTGKKKKKERDFLPEQEERVPGTVTSAPKEAWSQETPQTPRGKQRPSGRCYGNKEVYDARFKKRSGGKNPAVPIQRAT